MESKIKNWFIHDSNNLLGFIKNNIRSYLEKGDKNKLEKCFTFIDEHLYMNHFLYLEKYYPDSIGEIIKEWNLYKNYPKVEVKITNDFSINNPKKLKVRNIIGIISEFYRNAYKAGATSMIIEVLGDHLVISNNGKPIENVDKVFEEGFSTFGTTGLGMNLIKELCTSINIIDPINVTFKVFL